MKPVWWSPHALAALVDREIERADADRVIDAPEFVVDDVPGRHLYMGRYFDGLLGKQMLLRIVIEETAVHRVVVTIYKTSQLRKYLRGLAP